jgi:hypothetical protein
VNSHIANESAQVRYHTGTEVFLFGCRSKGPATESLRRFPLWMSSGAE